MIALRPSRAFLPNVDSTALLPWRTEAPYSGEPVDYAAQCRILSTLTHPHPQMPGKIADIAPVIALCSESSSGAGAAHARMIVERVNAHEALVTALLAVRDAFDTGKMSGLKHGPWDREVALDTLAAAEPLVRQALAQIGK
jgi:hypothetical protein